MNDLTPVGVGRLDLVVLDCPDPMALARFYAGILGWALEDDSDDSWATIRPDARGRRPDNTIPQQSHLDIDVPDLDPAEAAVLSAGATRTGLPSPETPDGQRDSFRVYLDPVGHPFCLCRESGQPA
jgi:predicted enzyme related to lactoylglutathione lyase